jgi:uncharacterized membrane protein YeaQ/YmgE (transglycosylase-associated protein family)
MGDFMGWIQLAATSSLYRSESHSTTADLVGWILLGLFAGAIARRVMPGEEKGGCLVTIVLGILGAVIGGWIGRNIGFLPDNNPGDWLPSLGSIVTATVGTMILLALWKWLRK